MDQFSRPPTAQTLDRLRSELEEFTVDAFEQSTKYDRCARLWQMTHLTVGLLTTVLTALSGATGLASTAGRIPAAIMALSATALAAAVRFLRSKDRYEKNRRRCNAWQVLAREARLASAADGHPETQDLYGIILDLLARRAIIIAMDHDPLPADIIHVKSQQPASMK